MVRSRGTRSLLEQKIAADGLTNSLRTPSQKNGGPLTNEQIEHLLTVIPGARRGAQGVILGNAEEGFFHITGVFPEADPERTIEDMIYYPVCAQSEIVRLRALKSSHDYLLRIRAIAVTDHPRLMRVMAKRRSIWETKGKAWSLTDYYASLNGPAKRYVARLPRNQQRMVRSTPFGFTAIVEANAVCMRTLSGDVITVSEALRSFYYFTIIALIGAELGVDQEDAVTAGLIAARIMIGSEAPDFDLDPRASPPAHIEARLRGYVESMLEFTFGHEFAHLRLGHLNIDAAQDGIAAYRRDQEFEADREAVLGVQDKAGRRELADGAYLVLYALQLVEQLSAQFSAMPKFSVSQTHPSPIERIWTLHDALGRADVGRKSAILIDLQTITDVTDAMAAAIHASRPDVLTFYGSIYLRGLGGKIREDRVDF